eukprot:293976_1
MSSSFRKLHIPQNVRLCNTITLYRCFSKTLPTNKNKPPLKKKEKNKNDIESVTKSLKLKFAIQKMDKDKSLYTYQTRQKIQNPSGYQDVKRRLRSNNIDDVMQIMRDYKKCEDVQVGTSAIKSIKILFEKSKITKATAIENIHEVWSMMEEYVVGMDCAAYNEYIHACSLMRLNRECEAKFNDMMNKQITPNEITLNILLGTCRYRGDTKTALLYWKAIVTDLDVNVNAESWASFIAVCINAENVQLAEEYFAKCPYKTSAAMCWRMISVYARCYNVDKILEMRNFMSKQNIEMNASIYQAIILGYRNCKQFQEASDMAKEAVTMTKLDRKTVNHLFEANIGLLKITNDFQRRKQILQYIESDVIKYFSLAGEDKLMDPQFGNRMLVAYIYAFREGFGSQTFEECCSKYHIQYWEQIEQLQIPTVDLYTVDYCVAKAILEYIFDKQIHVFRDLGLNMMINSNNDRFRYQFDTVTKQDVEEILTSLPTPMEAVQKDVHLLYVTSEQTQQFEHISSDDELFF